MNKDSQEFQQAILTLSRIEFIFLLLIIYFFNREKLKKTTDYYFYNTLFY
jgi:hypothetical protein